MEFETLESRQMMTTLADTLRADLLSTIDDMSPNSDQMQVLSENAYIDVDLSGVHLGRKSGTLISPDIVISAQHYGALPNPITFIAPDGTRHSRNIIAAAKVPDSGSLDIRLSRLDSPLPDDIATYKLPDPDFTVGDLGTAPVIMLEQHDNMHIGQVHPSTGDNPSYITIIKDKGRLGRLYKDLVGGDSGHPAFLVSNGEPVVVTTWHFPQAGPFTGKFQEGIRRTATGLGSTFPIESVEWGVPDDYSDDQKGKKGHNKTQKSEPLSDEVAAWLCTAAYPQTCVEIPDWILDELEN